MIRHAEQTKHNEEEGIVVDCDFPGGNIIVDGVEGDTVAIHQDLRDTEGDWFYWYFRVRGAAGRTLTFQFTRGNVIGVRGPAVSTNGGKTWFWLGSESVTDASFRYAFPEDAEEVRFCFAMPYLETNLREFLERRAGNPHLKVDVLCRSRKGREVELLHLGRLDGRCDHRVLLTCRHHACEMMASYSLEGIMEEVLADTEEGRWLREHVEFLVVPFVDKDGVEDGDQGKNRRPHDHNRVVLIFEVNIMKSSISSAVLTRRIGNASSDFRRSWSPFKPVPSSSIRRITCLLGKIGTRRKI